MQPEADLADRLQRHVHRLTRLRPAARAKLGGFERRYAIATKATTPTTIASNEEKTPSLAPNQGLSQSTAPRHTTGPPPVARKGRARPDGRARAQDPAGCRPTGRSAGGPVSASSR